MRRVSVGFVRAQREREMSLALSTSSAHVEFQPWYLQPAQDGGEERKGEREREKERLKGIGPGSTPEDLVASGYDGIGR